MIGKFPAAAAFAAGAIVLCTAGSTGAQQPLKHTGKPTQAAITAADAMTRLYIFADDSMMGREASSAGDRKGTAYIEREVRRLGLVPAGDNGTFFQSVPLYNLTVDMGTKLSADDTPLAVMQDFVPIFPEGTPKSVDGARVIFAGSTADAGNMIPAAAAEGKVVFIQGSTAGMARRYPRAAAFMIARSEPQLVQIRAFVSSGSQHMKSASDTVVRPMTIAIPTAAVQKFLGVPIENARPGTLGRTLRGTIKPRIEDTPARNVVAIIPGSDSRLRSQYVALGAHSDHVGISSRAVDHDSLRLYNQIAGQIYMKRTGEQPGYPGSGLTPDERATIRVNVDSLRAIRPARRDSINNGADDDGSGSMGLLEIAERFAGAKVKPKRSLLFVWHTAEESGLYGSEYFTDHPTVARDSIVAQLNIDMIGRGEATDFPGGGPDYIQLIGSRRLSREFGDLIEDTNRKSSAPFRLDYTFDANGHPEQLYCRSDHFEYARYGIPIVFMGTGGHADYHQVTDEPQYINYPHLVKVASFVADIAERVANLDHRVVVDKPRGDPAAACVQ